MFLAGDAAHIHPSDRRAGPEHQRPGQLQSRAGSLRPCWAARRRNCSRPMRRNAALSRPKCSGWRSGCLMKGSRGRCGAAARDATVGPRIHRHIASVAAPPSVMVCRLATGRRMRRCTARWGEPTRLFSLFRGPHWTLLVLTEVYCAAVAPRPGLYVRNGWPTRRSGR